MTLESFAKEHITERGGIRTPYFETEHTRVTTTSRIEAGKGYILNEVRE